MPRCPIYRLAGAAALTAALGIGANGSALACGRDCGGYGYRPAPVYAAPPVYSYSYVPYRAYRTVDRVSYYTTRVNIFAGPRWGYAAAYYNPRRHSGCGRRGYGCAYRAYMSGPIVHVSRPIGRSRRRW
jgi:hypothetical protein